MKNNCLRRKSGIDDKGGLKERRLEGVAQLNFGWSNCPTVSAVVMRVLGSVSRPITHLNSPGFGIFLTFCWVLSRFSMRRFVQSR